MKEHQKIHKKRELKTQEVKKMTIKELLGEQYVEGMTLEQVDELLKGKKLVDPESLPKSVKKETFDKTASELAEANRRLKEIEESKLTADERLKKELEEAENTKSLYKSELAKLKAKEIFVGAGLKEEDYSEILEGVVASDVEITVARANNMVKLINSQKEAVKRAVEADLLRGTSRPPATQGGDTFETLYKQASEAGDTVTMIALKRQQEEQNKQ